MLLERHPGAAGPARAAIRAKTCPPPIFKKGVLKLEDLTPGMELTGTVLNVVDFGAFVDIGMHDSGLVHVSQLADKFVRDPHDVVAVGDIVKVWVLEVDKERRRVSLTMFDPTAQSRAGATRRPAAPRRAGASPDAHRSAGRRGARASTASRGSAAAGPARGPRQARRSQAQAIGAARGQTATADPVVQGHGRG